MSTKLFVQRIGLIGLLNVLIGINGIILLPILTKNLSITDFGIWGLFQITISIASTIALFSLPQSITRFLPGETNEGRREALFAMTFLVFIFSLIVSVAIMLASEYIEKFLGNGILVALLALIVPINSINGMLFSFFVATNKMKRYTLLTLLQAYGDILLIAYLVRYGIIGIVIAFLIIRVILFVVMFYLIIREIGIAIPSFSRLREYLAFSIPLIPSKFSSWTVSSSDRYFIAYFISAAHVGLYTPGYTLGTIIRSIMTPIETVFVPTVTQLYDKKEIIKVKRYMEYSFKFILAFAIPSMFGVSILSKSILTILTTEEIAASSYIVTPFTAMSTVLIGSSITMTQILALSKRTKLIGAAWMVAAIANVILNILLIPVFGITGAAVTTLIAYGLLSIIIAYYAFKYFTFNIDFKFILKSIASSGVMSVTILMANPVQKFELIMWIFIGAGIYFFVLFILNGYTKEEIRFFRDFLKYKQSS